MHMKDIDRYLIREIAVPSLVAFFGLTALLLLNQMLDLVNMAVRRSVPFREIITLLSLNLPHIVVITLPMAFLVGILIGFARLSSDSEIVAMQSSGLSFFRILRPILLLAVLVYLVNLWVMVILLPWGNTALVAMRSGLLQKHMSQAIQPRVFFNEIPDLVLYADEVEDKGQMLRKLFIYHRGENGAPEILVGEKGQILFDQTEQTITITLQNSERHTVWLQSPEEYSRSHNAFQTIVTRNPALARSSQGSRQRGFREQSIGELVTFLREKKDLIRSPELRSQRVRTAYVEIHKRLAIPFSAFIFCLLGVPLGILNRRGGRTSNLAISLGVFLFYWICLASGEELAQKGILPPSLGMWGANLLLGAIGLYLLAWRDRLRGQSFLFQLLSFVPRWRLRVRVRGSRVSERELPKVRRMRFLLKTLDWYLLKLFLRFFVLCALALFSVFLLISFFDLFDEILRNDIAGRIVVAFYWYFSPQLLYWSLPVALLFTTLLTFGVLSQRNELTAIKAHGVSLYSLCVPILLCAFLFSGLSFFLSDYILPEANNQASTLKNTIKGRAVHLRSLPRQWVFGAGYRLYNFTHYDAKRKMFYELSICDLDEHDFSVKRRIQAESATVENNRWHLLNGWERDFRRLDGDAYQHFEDRTYRFSEGIDYFEAGTWAGPEGLSFIQLRDHIRTLTQKGYDVNSLWVGLYSKLTDALLPFLMVFIALPFAFRMGHRGAMVGIGVSLMLGSAYFITVMLFTAFGNLGLLPPFLSAFAPVILFGLGSAYLLLNIKT